MSLDLTLTLWLPNKMSMDTQPTTPQPAQDDFLTRIIENKPLTAVARVFMLLGGLLGAMFLWVANGAIHDIHDTKLAVVALQLQILPQLTEVQAEIRDIKNNETINRSDINRLQDHIMSAQPPALVISPPNAKHTR